MNDPNWFFSATAQSFAAIVAIIGGFILSKFISLSLDKRNLESRINKLKDKLKNNEEHYKEKILEWKNPIEKILFSYIDGLFLRKIKENFENELKKEINEINSIFHFKKFEEKYKEILILCYKIKYVSHEIGYKLEKIGFDNIEEIMRYLNNNKNEFNEMFEKYELDYKYKDKVFSYIENHKKGEHFKNKIKIKEFLELNRNIENIYSEWKRDLYIKASYSNKEAKLLELWEEHENLNDEKSQCKSEIESIREDKILRESWKPLFWLFSCGVVAPLFVLIFDFLWGKYVNNTYYIIPFVFIILIITISLIKTIRHFKNQLNEFWDL